VTTSPTPQVEPAPPGKQLPRELFRHWIHSREEDRDGIVAYRPEGYPFPASFGREGFEMRPGGRVLQDVVGPADGTVQVPGHWRQVGPARVAFRFASDRQPDYAFEIVAVDDAMLRLRRLPS
jgi:hypothetical protein